MREIIISAVQEKPWLALALGLFFAVALGGSIYIGFKIKRREKDPAPPPVNREIVVRIRTIMAEKKEASWHFTGAVIIEGYGFTYLAIWDETGSISVELTPGPYAQQHVLTESQLAFAAESVRRRVLRKIRQRILRRIK